MYDINKDGNINFPEFMRLMKVIDDKAIDDDIELLF